jgi:hypothetical protein
MNAQEWYAHETGELDIDPNDDEQVLPEEDRMQRALGQAYAIKQTGWRIVLRAEQHVMRDLELPWRTRFEVSGFLWRHALELCKDRILGL